VQLNLRDADSLRAAWARIEANLAAHGFADALEGMLVAQMVMGGLELVMGVHRDPEMGPVIMGGSGGVLLELVRDVAFAAPPLTLAKAHDLIARTKAGALMKGYRGSEALDAQAYAQALLALGRLANDLGDALDSIDVNPFLLRREGGMALDALVVLRPPAR
jgi:hypothetical protein